MRAFYGSADQVGKFTVFNIAGNKYRLIVHMNYRTRAAYICFIGTHEEYDAINPETV